MINQIVEFNKTFVAQKEIMVVAHSHCGACHMSYDHFHHEKIARGVTDETRHLHARWHPSH